MKSLFVPSEESKELKELGFDIPTFSVYNKHGKLSKKYSIRYRVSGSEYTLAPLYSQVFKWFRKKGYDYEILRSPILNTLYGKTYYWNIIKSNEEEFTTNDNYDTHEEAELACVRELINIVKKTK